MRTVSIRRIALIVFVAGLVSQPRPLAQQSADVAVRLVGSWGLVAYDLEFEDTHERLPVFGAHPDGYILFGADGRTVVYLEAEGRKAPLTDADRAAAYRTIIAYTGRYRVEGNKWVTAVDGAWNVAWIGTNQEREFTIAGNRLTVISQWNPNPVYGNRQTRGHLTFEREH